MKNGYFTWWPFYIYDNIMPNSSLNEKLFRKSCTEYQNTHFIFKNVLPKIKPFMISWKNMLQPYRLHVIKHMHFAYWITKATDTTLVYITLLLFHGNNGYTNTSILCYMYAACLVSFQCLQIFPVKVQKPADLAFCYKALKTTAREKETNVHGYILYLPI